MSRNLEDLVGRVVWLTRSNKYFLAVAQALPEEFARHTLYYYAPKINAVHGISRLEEAQAIWHYPPGLMLNREVEQLLQGNAILDGQMRLLPRRSQPY